MIPFLYSQVETADELLATSVCTSRAPCRSNDRNTFDQKVIRANDDGAGNIGHVVKRLPC
jgi:hypothetical protein